ncbi:touch insensitive larva B [Oratosquilla oratoria]|uniref:touch insensitive larva B n=1 Tax=Oratosquilla oratoria TaxID=337810 RepID=UPI003F76A977
MGILTLDQLRRRAEHNEGELSTLEEVALHQLGLEGVDQLHRWCPRLKILLLQGNLLADLGPIGRLRELEYLNVALNNLESLGDLGRCEALRKVDLTANFVTNLTSLASLQDLPNLEEVYLTGNPCTDYEGYREWLVCALPQITTLDGNRITKAERLRALQRMDAVSRAVHRDQKAAIENRRRQKENYEQEALMENFEKEKKTDDNDDDDDDDDKFWHENSVHSPEERVFMQREMDRRRQKAERKSSNKSEELFNPQRKPPRLFSRDGRPLNVNQARVEFDLKEDLELGAFVLEVHTYRYLDPSQLKADVEPWYVRVAVKGRVLQLVLLEEVRTSLCTAQRSQTTGHLVITMPKMEEPRFQITPAAHDANSDNNKDNNSADHEKSDSPKSRNFLEVDPTTKKSLSRSDLANITSSSSERSPRRRTQVNSGRALRSERRLQGNLYLRGGGSSGPPERPNSPDFVEDPEVPPLE